jgi:hypothetical protein
MQIDIHTLAIVLGLANFLHLLALLTQFKVGKTYSGMGWWTLGTAVYAVAFAFSYAQDAPFIGSTAIVVSTTLSCCALSLIYVGILRFMGQRERRGMLIAFCAAIALCEVYFSYIIDSPGARGRIISLAILLISVAIVRALAGASLSGSIALSRYFLIFVFSCHICLEAATALISANSAHDLFRPAPIRVVFYLGSLATSTLWTFGFILLINQRLVAEREVSIRELNAAFEEIKTLSGILPICSYCKKVRDDQGYWEQVESYVSRHTEASFSHGICPECLRTLYAGYPGGQPVDGGPEDQGN